jgi:two-component system, NarL family, response regulator NreC
MSIKLLLASDYAMVREGLHLLLQPAREIQLIGEAECLPDAPQKFHELQPDVVLMNVPATNSSGGLRTMNRLMKGSPEARAVVLTNNHDVSYVRSMLAAGARGYVLTQSRSCELIAAIRTAAEGNKFIDPQLSSAITHHRSSAKKASLTQREWDVLRQLAHGYTNSQTASHLHLTARTVEAYRARIARKLHLHNRAELVHYAIANGLLN